MSWLLTGGAGYIGAHVALALRGSGRDVVVLDDLSTGSVDRLPPDLPLVHASVLDGTAVREAMRRHRVTGVVHLAAKKPSQSRSPSHSGTTRRTWRASGRCCRPCVTKGVDQIVFSSSAAVYGMPDVDLVTEDLAGRAAAAVEHRAR